jgi:beta-glucosidase
MKATPLSIASLALIVFSPAYAQQPRYRDPSQPVRLRVKDLIERMTLEEKLGQLNIPTAYNDGLIAHLKLKRKDVSAQEGTLATEPDDLKVRQEACRQFATGRHPAFRKMGPIGGFFTLGNRLLPYAPREMARFQNELQRLARQTRLGIPLLQVEEGTHGYMASNGTIFPEGLALGSTWNVDLIRVIYATAMRQGRAAGAHALCTLVVEPNIDPRMGRNAEGYSEDPYICSAYARAIVEGIQGDGVEANDRGIAVLCHFPGQSQGFAGLEFNDMEMSERNFRNIFLPPWESGIREAGALMVMATHPSFEIFGGVPAHASKGILTDLLRQELHFQGAVLGEGNSVRTILWKRVLETQKQAGRAALNAGLDVSISLEPGFIDDMHASVREGAIAMELVDQAVERVLRLKFLLGLFENPFAGEARAEGAMNTAADRELALRAAREGIVLLKNENNLLPLSMALKSVAVIGPLADAKRDQLGDYTPSHIRHEVVTPLAGIRAKLGAGAQVRYVQGVEVLDPAADQIKAAVAAAGSADAAIVVVGETSECVGEKNDSATLELLGRQNELVQAVKATGKPVVVVLINGRPLTINWIAQNVPAVVEAWFPGEQGGHAIADVLFGDYNPSGRLAITIPRHAGQLPAYYFYKPSKEQRRNPGRRKTAYVDLPMEPLFEFGHGLSYTTYEYRNLKITPERAGRGSTVTVNCDVTNAGGIAGVETVQLYLRDEITSVTSPIRLLKGFRKVHLKPGETKTVTMTLGPRDLSLLDANLQRVVEPGTFEVMIGKSCENIALRGRFTVAD